MKPNDVVLMVGLGMMGGSYAMALRRAGFCVNAVDCDAEALAYALDAGFICEGVTMPVEDSAGPASSAAKALIAHADVLIFALYPTGFLPWLRSHHALIKPGAMVTDMLGVKGAFVEEAQQLLMPHNEFIATHPMAGSEKSGVQNANAAIFKGANFIITPTARNTAAGVAFARGLAELLGFGRITVLSVAEHDELIGYVSQLAHVMAVCLMNGGQENLAAVTGDSFRDLTRIADINTALWSELFFANAPVLVRQIDIFLAEMDKVRRCLLADDRTGLAGLLNSAGQRRRTFGQKPTA